MKRINRFWMVGALFALHSSLAHAQELPRTAHGRAEWFNARGDNLIRQNPAEAAQFYLRAYSEVPDCTFLHNAAIAFEQANTIDSLDRAIANYRLYLASDRSRCETLRMRERVVRNSVARIEAELANRRLRQPPVTTLTAVQTPPVPVPVVTPPQPPVVVVTPHPVVAPPRYRSERSTPILSYTLWGVGAFTLGFGIYSFVVSSSESDLARQQGVNDPDRHRRAAESASLWGGISLGVGVAAIGAGVGLYVLRPTRQVLITPHVSARSAGLAATFRF